MRWGVTSRSRPNIKASIWPDISPFLREMMTPIAKKEVRTTAAAASCARCRIAQVNAAATNIAQIPPPAGIQSIPPKTAPTTIPGKIEWTEASAPNCQLRRLTRVPTAPAAIPKSTRKSRGRRKKGESHRGGALTIALNIVNPAESFIDDLWTENLGGWPIGNLAPRHNQALIAHFGCDPIVMG